jgi:prolyl-tRNA editing enzyme YbaK/EbsC (Cys-tRNA(Pro) deacylase)
LFNLAAYVDPALAEHASINFNAGDHSISIQMMHADYLKAEQPIVVEMT